MKYLNPRMSYYYFRFPKLEVRHRNSIFSFDFDLPVVSGMVSASSYQISSKSVNTRQSYRLRHHVNYLRW